MDERPERPADPPMRRRAGRLGGRAGAVVLLVLVVGLLGSPLRTLSVLGTLGHRASGTDPSSAEPATTTTASVTTSVPAPGDAASQPPSATSAVPGRDGPEGRWGVSADRPEGTRLLLEEFRGGWRVEGGAEEAAALAAIAAHAWADAERLRSGSAALAGDAGAVGAIVAVEAVERPGPSHAVVTVLVAPDGADGPLHRIAVPIAIGEQGSSLAGEPWRLPAPTLGLTPVTGRRVTDPALIASARLALDAVGLPGDRLVALEATDGWPFIARLDDEAGVHPWLRWHLDRFVVTGLPLRRTGGT